ncbi:hypothetical protein F5Y06DRAFT_281267 [Hypoxylon sp. FL0890]|nr:hypothetical protein F5Y06DRAFT_281267 [Hypoxylon sp. FL0890]
MYAIRHGYSLLTPGQHLLSPNSTGHSNSGKYPPHRCHSHSCKSAPTEQHWKENSREYEDEHWLFSTQPHSFHLRLATSGACSPCQTRRPPETCRDWTLTPVSPNPVESQKPKCRQERGAEDELIYVWLSTVYRSNCSNCLNAEAELATQNTPAVPQDLEDKVEAVANLTYPMIVLQPPRRNRSTAQSGTGLDGPQSSESDKLSKRVRDGLNDLKESSRSTDLSVSSRKLRSSTSGSIDWDKTWEKRKPRRKHDVSEASNLNYVPLPHGDDLLPAANDSNDINSGSSSGTDSDGVSDNKSCLYLSQHDAQFHVIQKHAANSCPELQHQLEDFDKSLPRPKTGDSQEQTTRLRFKLNENQHRHLFHVRNLVTMRFRSLGRKFKRSGSSNLSVQSDFPAPRNSKERRRLARESMDAWPSSGEETPVFNTPESNITNAGTPRAAGHHFDPLAMASMMIATAELDRLSSRGSLDQTSRTSGSSNGFSGSSPVSQTPLHTGPTSPNNETPESTALNMPPTIPFNTPSSSGPPSGIVSPLSRPSLRRGQRRRGQRSRLSEVTTPDEITSPDELAEEPSASRPSLSLSQIEILPECSTTLNEGKNSLYPKPLAIKRNSGDSIDSRDDGLSENARVAHLASGTPDTGALSAKSPEKPGSPSQLTRESSLKRQESISPPSRVSSISKTPEFMYGPKLVPINDDGQELPVRPPRSLTFSPDVETAVIPTSASNGRGSTTIAIKVTEILLSTPEVGSATAAKKPNEDTSPESCHPNTWSETQGEPGDSDPFCPPDCLETRHSSQDSQGTADTVVRMLSVGESTRPKRYSDSEVAGRRRAQTAKDERRDNSEPA